MRLRSVIVILAALCAACRSGRGTTDVGNTPPTISSDTSVFTEATSATLRVESRHRLEVNVFVLTPDGTRHRLGRVGTARTASFNIARFARLNGVLRFVAEPLGTRSNFSTRVISSSVIVKLGNEARWTIESDVTRSHIEVR